MSVLSDLIDAANARYDGEVCLVSPVANNAYYFVIGRRRPAMQERPFMTAHAFLTQDQKLGFNYVHYDLTEDEAYNRHREERRV